MERNSDNLFILRAQAKITETEKMLKWVVRHIDDVATLDFADSEFNSLISNAIRNLDTIRSIILRHEEPINLQVEAIKLYDHLHSAKGYLERVKMEEDPERYWQRRCGSLDEMLSGVSQRLNQSKREGAIFDNSDERLKPLKARKLGTLEVYLVTYLRQRTGHTGPSLTVFCTSSSRYSVYMVCSYRCL